MQISEVRALTREELRLIILLEARAAPRLQTVEGLWRKSTKKRPGSMTAFIRNEGLLDASEIDAIIANAPLDLLEFQRAAAAVPIEQRSHIQTWIERFNAGLAYPSLIANTPDDDGDAD